MFHKSQRGSGDFGPGTDSELARNEVAAYKRSFEKARDFGNTPSEVKNIVHWYHYYGGTEDLQNETH